VFALLLKSRINQATLTAPAGDDRSPHLTVDFFEAIPSDRRLSRINARFWAEYV
jgi:hypothetical protein